MEDEAHVTEWLQAAEPRQIPRPRRKAQIKRPRVQCAVGSWEWQKDRVTFICM